MIRIEMHSGKEKQFINLNLYIPKISLNLGNKYIIIFQFNDSWDRNKRIRDKPSII